jgi:hypothetical protein
MAGAQSTETPPVAQDVPEAVLVINGVRWRREDAERAGLTGDPAPDLKVTKPARGRVTK